MRHECEITSNQTMANPSELDGKLCNDLVGISRRKLGDVFGANPAGVRMLHAPRHRRPDDVELPDVDWRGLPRSNACLGPWSAADAHRGALLLMIDHV